jgi:hypothetical protein
MPKTTLRRLLAENLVSLGRSISKPIVWATVTGWLATIIVAMLVAMILTPRLPVDAYGQRASVGITPPNASISGSALVTENGTSLPLIKTHVWGPLRPQLDLEGPLNFSGFKRDGSSIQTTASRGTWHVAQALAYWYALATIIYWFMVWAILNRIDAIRQRCFRTAYCTRSRRWFRRLATLTWIIAVCCSIVGTTGLLGVHTLDQMVGDYVAHVDPAPTGTTDVLDQGAVIGDSRAALLGGLNSRGWCFQSTDSLAALLSQLTSQSTLPAHIRFRNLACSGATVEKGLLGPQKVGSGKKSRLIPPQVGVLKQIKHLHYVVVMIGPNDVDWSAQIGLCMFTNSCNNKLTAGVDFDARLMQFAFQFNDLLEQLYNLPTHPYVTVDLSYNAMEPSSADTGCSDATGLTASEIQQMVRQNDQLNHYEQLGARAYHFVTVMPDLTMLCQPNAQIHHVWDSNGAISPYAFHPTHDGEEQIASQDFSVLINRTLNSQLPSSTQQPNRARHLAVAGPPPFCAFTAEKITTLRVVHLQGKAINSIEYARCNHHHVPVYQYQSIADTAHPAQDLSSRSIYLLD